MKIPEAVINDVSKLLTGGWEVAMIYVAAAPPSMEMQAEIADYWLWSEYMEDGTLIDVQIRKYVDEVLVACREINFVEYRAILDMDGETLARSF